MPGFELLTSPRIVFGPQSLDKLESLASPLGSRPLLVLGGQSADASGLRRRLERLLPSAALVRCHREPTVEDVQAAVDTALATLESYQRELAIPRLSELGIGEPDLPRIIAASRGSSMRYNPVDLSDSHLEAILKDAS